MAEAEAARDAAEARAREEVARYQLELQSALANRAKAQEAVELAREWPAPDGRQLPRGRGHLPGGGDANTTLTQAEVGLVAERLQASLAALRLLKTVGAFPPPSLSEGSTPGTGEQPPAAPPAQPQSP